MPIEFTTNERFRTTDHHAHLSRLSTGFVRSINREQHAGEVNRLRNALYGVPEQRNSRVLAELGQEEKHLARDYLVIESILNDHQYGTGSSQRLSTDYACILLQHMDGEKPPKHLESLIELYFRCDAGRKLPPGGNFGKSTCGTKEKYFDNLHTTSLLFNMVYNFDILPFKKKEGEYYFTRQLVKRNISAMKIDSKNVVPVIIEQARKNHVDRSKNIVKQYEKLLEKYS